MATIRKSAFLFLTSIIALHSFAQHIEMLQGGRRTSLRGLSPVSDKVIWVSGSAGSVGLTTDGGSTWKWITVPGFEKREFRDIEAFDGKTAIAIAVAEPGQIVRTTDGGETWKIVYTDSSKGVFLDAMDFADQQHGLVIGDPLPGTKKIYCLFTADQGENWSREDLFPEVAEGEAMFAASGTNIIFPKYSKSMAQSGALVITGGKESNLLRMTDPRKVPLPLLKGAERTGANGMAHWNQKTLVVVGGDFAHDRDTTGNCSISTDGGKTWERPDEPPHGYRSSVAFARAKWLAACGSSGVDVSTDGGKTWSLITVDGFNVCKKAKKGKIIFLAGNNGRIAQIVW